MNFRLLAVYGAFEALLLLSSAFFGRAWFYSSQTAFFGSLLVLAATFRAYKKRVENGVRDYDASKDDDIDEWGENHEEFPDCPQSAKFDGYNPHRENAEPSDASNLSAYAKTDAEFSLAVELNLKDKNERVKFDENLTEQAKGENLSKQAKFDAADSSNLSERNRALKFEKQNLNENGGDKTVKFIQTSGQGRNERVKFDKAKDQNEVAQDKFDELNLNDANQGDQSNLSQASESNLNESSADGETKPPKKQNFAQNLKQNSPNFFTAFVPFRLIAYAVLVVGFLALKRHGNLDIAAFLIALAVMPAGALIYGVRSNEN